MIRPNGWRIGLLGGAVALCFASSGCTAIFARAKIAGAEGAIGEAEASGAKTKATYKYDMALLYLEKAREEEAYSRLGPAMDMGSKSEEFAKAAHDEATGEKPSRTLPPPPADVEPESRPSSRHTQADPEPL